MTHNTSSGEDPPVNRDASAVRAVPRRRPPCRRPVLKEDTQQPHASMVTSAEAAPAAPWPQLEPTRPRTVFFVVDENMVATATDGDRATLLRVSLPTGRQLLYRDIILRSKTVLYAPSEWFSTDRRGCRDVERFFPEGQRQVRLTRRALVADIIQAISRDVLGHMCMELESLGLRVAFTRDDEAIFECGACGCPNPDTAHTSDCAWVQAISIVQTVMSRVPSSLPRLADLPIACHVNGAVRLRYA